MFNFLDFRILKIVLNQVCDLNLSNINFKEDKQSYKDWSECDSLEFLRRFKRYPRMF
jgi:hypothetical protein